MGLLGDMAKAAAKVAINQVSNTAHEKVSEMFPTKEIVLSGSHERDVYTYYGGPLKGIRVGQTFDAEVARKPVTLVSELTGTEWNTAEHGNNALKCKTNGVRVFGYASNEADEYVINEDEAAFVREAFKRRIAKETTNSIARDFAARGVKTSQGNPCGYSMVERMVKNRKYTGRYEWGGVVKEGGMPAIIDEVTFMEAQGIRAAKERSAESWGDFALSGKAICAGCGRNLQGVSGRGRGNRKYEYYRCHDGCVKPVRREELEGEIVKALRALLQDREEALRIARMVAESSDGAEVAARRKQAAQSLSAAERGLKNILNAIEQGIIAPGAKERIAELEHQRDRAKLDLEAIRDDQIDPERLADFLQCGSALDDATLLKAFVYQVSVSDEECIVTLNYDVESNEPARLDVQRVRTKCKWCTVCASPRTEVCAVGTIVFVRIPRAA